MLLRRNGIRHCMETVITSQRQVGALFSLHSGNHKLKSTYWPALGRLLFGKTMRNTEKDTQVSTRKTQRHRSRDNLIKPRESHSEPRSRPPHALPKPSSLPFLIPSYRALFRSCHFPFILRPSSCLAICCVPLKIRKEKRKKGGEIEKKVNKKKETKRERAKL